MPQGKPLIPLASSRAALAASLLALISCGEAVAPLTPRTPKPPAEPCRPGPGVSGSPRTIEQSVTLINALPRPLSIECFVKALDHPLRIVATDSEFSAQPALGRQSPRVFILLEPLILSVSLGPRGIHLLEFGQLLDDGSSIKAELEFPITEAILPKAAPYAHIVHNERISRCSSCHTQERVINTIDDTPIFASRALKPVDYQIVPTTELTQELERCADQADQAQRCALLEAIFAFELPPQPGVFDEDLDTFF